MGRIVGVRSGHQLVCFDHNAAAVTFLILYLMRVACGRTLLLGDVNATLARRLLPCQDERNGAAWP